MTNNGKILRDTMDKSKPSAKKPVATRVFPSSSLKDREYAYKTIRPSDYLDINNYARFLFNNQREEFDDERSEEAFRFYLGLENKPKYIRPSKYKPTINADKNGQYYSVDDELEQDIFRSYKDIVKPGQIHRANEAYVTSYFDESDPRYFKENGKEYMAPTPGDKNLLFGRPMTSNARMLGNFVVSRGKDDKGEYLSYADQYDFPDKFQEKMQGQPYKIYGRVYYPKQQIGGVILDPRGQWAHPGRDTIIPSGRITMQGVPYPVYGQDETGYGQMMYPGREYKFPGQMVYERPMMQTGGLWDTNRTQWVDSVNHSPANAMKNFVQRFYQIPVQSIPTPGGRPGQTSTHLMAYDNTDVYPTVVQLPNGKLKFLGDGDPAWNYAHDNNEFIKFKTPEQAAWYANNGYKQGKGVLGKKKTGGQMMQYGGLPEYQSRGEVDEYPMMGGGGYVVTRSHDRKGKTHKVTGPDGTVKYFGDSKLGQHPDDPERKKAFYARHKHNLDKNPFFRAFARATWAEGGELNAWIPRAQEGYVVKKGDTLKSIAKAQGVSLKDLIAANQLANPNLITVNQKLNMPGMAAQQMVQPPMFPVRQTAAVEGTSGYQPIFNNAEERARYQENLTRVAEKALREENDQKYLLSTSYHDINNGNNCINGVCGLNLTAGLKYANPTDEDRYLSGEKFAVNVAKGKEDFYMPTGNFQIGDHIMYRHNVGTGSHNKIIYGIGENAAGEKVYKIIDNGGGSQMRGAELTEDQLKEHMKTGIGNYNKAVIYRPGYSLDKEKLSKERVNMTPEALQAYQDRGKMINWETSTDPGYEYSVREDSKYAKNQPEGMKKFVEYANNKLNIDALVQKLGVPKSVVHDELLNTFGELGQENKWADRWIGGTGGLENAFEKIFKPKNSSIGPGQIKFNSISPELKKKFNINRPADLYDFEKVIPLMTAINVRNREWLERKGDKAGEYITGEEGSLPSDIGRYTPALYRGLAPNIMKKLRKEAETSLDGFRMSKADKEQAINDYINEHLTENQIRLAPGSYSGAVYNNIDQNLQRVKTNVDSRGEILPNVTITAKRKQMGGENFFNYGGMPCYECGGMYAAGGEMIRRADGSYSRRGLWDNIRANRGSGKEPTKEMLEQERKIRANSKQFGGNINNNTMHSFYDFMAMGGTSNPGFRALPDYVQHKILSNMSMGGSTFSGNAFYQDGGGWHPEWNDQQVMSPEADFEARLAAEAAADAQGTSAPVMQVVAPAAPKARSNRNDSIVDYLNANGAKSDYATRKGLADMYGITDYTGRADQNLQLLKYLSSGRPSARQQNSNGEMLRTTYNPVTGRAAADSTGPLWTQGSNMAPITVVGKKNSGNGAAIATGVGIAGLLATAGLTAADLMNTDFEKLGSTSPFKGQMKRQLTLARKALINKAMEASGKGAQEAVAEYLNSPKKLQKILDNLDANEIAGDIYQTRPGTAMRNLEAHRMNAESRAEESLMRNQEAMRMQQESLEEAKALRSANARKAAAVRWGKNTQPAAQAAQESNAFMDALRSGYTAMREAPLVNRIAGLAKYFRKEDGGPIDYMQEGGWNVMGHHVPEWAKTTVQVLDPTGISSYGDAYDAVSEAYNHPSWGNAGQAALEVFSALPIVGKAGKAAKAGSRMAKAMRTAEKVLTPVAKMDRAFPMGAGVAAFNQALLKGAPGYVRGIANLGTNFNQGRRFFTGAEGLVGGIDNMMGYAPSRRDGGGIHINPANAGKFTASANAAGMGIQEFAAHVLANRDDYSSTQVKRANFARNASKWKHQSGGPVVGQEMEVTPEQLEQLRAQGYQFEII